MSQVAQRLAERIRSTGPLPFSEFMAEALYGERGYYRQDESPIGQTADFVTGSSLSPLFGRATARMLAKLDEFLGEPAGFLEVGYGDGRHLAGMLAALGEGSDRRLLAHDRVPRDLPAGVERVSTLADLPQHGLCGMVFSYELFDALPINRLIGRSDGGVGELWVGLNAVGGFEYLEGSVSDPALLDRLEDTASPLAPGQIVDVAVGWAPLYRDLADRLGRGLLVTCDYGFERDRLFDPRVRMHGTLACYRRHHVHRDALRDVGRQDLTAHVDFTTLRDVGEENGLTTIAFTRQARWLLACGLFEDIQSAEPPKRIEAMDLLNPGGMGEEIRVLVQARDIDAGSLPGLDLLVNSGPGRPGVPP